MDAEAAVEQAEAGGGRGLAGGLGDPGLEPAHRAGALAGEDDPLAPGEAEDRGDVVRLPDREQVDEAAAADVDQVLGEQVVAQRHRPAAEPEEGEVGGLAGALAEGGVEAADLLGGVAAGGRQDADPRPLAAALGGQPQQQLADRAVGRARGEVVAAEGEDAARSSGIRRRPRWRAPPAAARPGRLRASPRKVVAIRISTTRCAGDVEPVAAGLGPRGDHPAQLGAGEVQRGAVLGGVAGAHPLAEEVVVGVAPLGAAARSGRSC